MIEDNEKIDVLNPEDERQISAVMVRYATGIDSRDWGLFRTCFTDDFCGDYGRFGSWTSGEDITRSMEGMHELLGPTLHRITNIVMAAAPGGAVARTYVDAILMSKEIGGGVNQAVGYYDDELVRSDGGWRIKNRRFTMVRLVQSQT